MASTRNLKTYQSKRDFRESPEPRGSVSKTDGRLYVIQSHDASRHHYDFRLELDGVLLSWAIPKGPSLDPSDKRLAVRTEDHPVDYGGFEGVIPKGYGAGTVMLWDRGEWEAKDDPREALEKGELKFTLKGARLKGGWALVRMKGGKDGGKENWLLVKEKDDHADPETEPGERWTTSVKSRRKMKTIADEGQDLKKGKRYSPGGRAATKPKKSSSGQGGGSSGAKSKGKNAGTGNGGMALEFIEPQLATLVDDPPEGEEWLHEIKYDGYRIQAKIKDGEVRLISRNGKDWTDRYPDVAGALKKLKIDSAVMDGELVALDDRGHSNFSRLQQSQRKGDVSLRYYVFDLLHLDGKDIRKSPLTDRKAKLADVVPAKDQRVRYSDHIEGSGEATIEKACDMGMEGIVSKKADAPYKSGRGRGWLKSKCVGDDEFVIVGYRRSDKRGRPFSSLLLGAWDGDELVYRGRVGTGYDARDFDELGGKLDRLSRKTCPLADPPSEARRGAVWVTPKLVAQVAYTEMTGDGLLRHPSYKGLREDKAAREVRTGSPQPGDGENEMELENVRITSPDKVLFPEQGATKRRVAEYLHGNAERILTWLADRPLTFVRCPDGRDDECFFQQHHTASTPDEIGWVEIEESGGKTARHLVISDARGLVAAAQIAVLEFHLWGARKDRIDRPERIVFDLDPDEGLDFRDVRAAARELKDILEGVGLKSYPMLTGGKGIHVIVPIQRRRGWDDVKAFAAGLARRMAAADPDGYVAQASKAKRKGRIFIDWLRNERGATAIAPYSPRARAGAPVATPVGWEELARIDRANRYTLDNIGARLKRLKSDPWEGYGEERQSVTDELLAFVKAD
ncbi:DNA ligase D [Minwuia thermotolerans]|uniref:DNA ligase (ATP) n=1 Tax=Minwuia thermotolerans TaxID=2056226 RepID=A0A2M9G2I4_9PROT|nr:DNA ligase D [Minwuia thermotolerans]PJK29918.1 DNA ligase D [Minwuia thermotolerans]